MEIKCQKDSASMGYKCLAKVSFIPEFQNLDFFKNIIIRLIKKTKMDCRDLGIEVRDFGESWRDGNAFLGLIDAIKTNVINIAALKEATNKYRLEKAFDVAEVELGIARLLDPEDVDVPRPDEKSVMTYVAQFLHKYPEPKGSATDSFAAVQQDYNLLIHWLNDRINNLDYLDKTNSFSNNYEVSHIFKLN